MTATTKSSNLESCIQACLQCLKDCENCATACLESDMVQMMAECIKRCRDCVDTCALWRGGRLWFPRRLYAPSLVS